MNKYDALFIRACKSHNPGPRLNSVCRRFYVADETSYPGIIRNRLAGICQRFDLIGVQDLIDKLDPSNAWKYNDDDSDFRKEVLISTVRYAQVDKFPEDYPVSARFRNSGK